MTPRNRSRLVLVLLVLLFAAPVGIAALLHASGWEPARTRNHGMLLDPPIALEGLVLHRADGTDYAWDPPARRWQIAVFPAAECEAACVDLIAGLDKVWQLQGRRADRLDVLWFGEMPQGAVPFRRFLPMQPLAELEARLPDAPVSGATRIFLIDPRGFVALSYPGDVDVAHLREDVARLLK